MAYAANYNASAVNTARGASFFAGLLVKFSQYMLFRKTVAELSALSNRELSDLGLSRSGIKASAIEAVYGN